MLIKKGIPVSPGIVISKAVVIDAEDVSIPKRTIDPQQLPIEHQRLEIAILNCSADIDKLRQQAQNTVGDLARIFDFHLSVLQDKSLISQFNQLIDEQSVTAEYAVYTIMHQQAKALRQTDDPYFRERDRDIWDLEKRILGHLIGNTRAQLAQIEHEAVVVAHDLTPSQTAGLDTAHIKALVTDAGGATSHTAILAHALGIPAVVGLEDITSHVNAGDTIIIDGNHGLVIVDPNPAKLLEYREYEKRMAALESTLDQVAQLPAITKDGVEVRLYANIEFPSEIPAAVEKGATGVGLYRTEFLYLSSDSAPTEDQQYQAYTQALTDLDGRPLTIRTLDLGADKFVPEHTGISPTHEHNPFLGCRSIRLCLQNLPLFNTQLRAILRASVHGQVRVMFPLISNIMELRQAKMIFHDVKEDLDDDGIAYADDIMVGMMVEVPSAAIQIKTFAREVDFFSIGTNDLIQYTLAVDRGNERIASLYSATHPAVVTLLKDVIRTCTRMKKPVGLCGEMACEPEHVMLLLGLGLRSFSVTPPALLKIKQMVRSVTIGQCQRVARRAVTLDSDRQIRHYLRDEARKAAPQVFDDLGDEL